jgi:catechol 2,3-dioxygenase-like lactoylglutathione lyase family enzyme
VLDHVTISVTDLAAGIRFYDAALTAVGFVQLAELADDEEEDDPPIEAVGWGTPDGRTAVWLVSGVIPTAGLHLCFRVASHVEVETFFTDAVQAGGTGFAAPRRWAIYRRGEVNAIVRDPAGNLVEAVAAE